MNSLITAILGLLNLASTCAHVPDVNRRSLDESSPVYVGLLDGALHAVDVDTGKTLWSLQTGQPMVSSFTAPDVPLGAPKAPHFFPGVDGDLYHYNLQEQQLEKLPLSVQDLVQQSPSLTGNGAPVLGSRESTVYYLHRQTGQLLSEFRSNPQRKTLHRVPPGDEDWLPDNLETDAPDEDLLRNVAADDIIAVARVDYVVRAEHPFTHEPVWNVSYAVWHHLPLPETDDFSPPLLDVASGIHGVRGVESVGDSLGSFATSTLMLSRNVLSRAALPAHGGSSDGDHAWVRRFAAPLTYAFSLPPRAARGAMSVVHPPPPGSALVAAAHHHDSFHGARWDDRVVADAGATVTVEVGRLGNSLYALPVNDAGTVDPVGAGSQGRVPALPSSRGVEDVVDGRETSAMVEAVPEHGEADDFMCPLGKVQAMPPVGVRRPPWLPHRIPPPSHRPYDHAPYDEGQLRGRGGAMPLIVLTLFIGLMGLVLFMAYSMMQYHMAGARTSHPSGLPYRGPQPVAHVPVGQSTRLMPPEATPNSSRDSLYLNSSRESGASLHSRSVSMPEAMRNSSQHDSTAAPLPPTEHKLPDGRTQIGNLFITENVLGYGSSTHGTVVFEGSWHGRTVAVKRMLAQFHDVAQIEIAALIESDEHPNILRCFSLERSGTFVYLALERCKLTLYDAFTQPDVHNRFTNPGVFATETVWRIARDAAEGVQALHANGIVHRDLKPQNVLLTESLRGKVSDMGLSKKMAIHQSSFDSLGCSGSSGWQAPEQIQQHCQGEARVRQSRAIDVFSLGLVLYYTFSAGGHPFGEDRYQRDGNILNVEPDLSDISDCTPLQNLIRSMLRRNPKERPNMTTVLAHPVWWPPQKRLQFLIDTSDRFETLDRASSATEQALLKQLEDSAGAAFAPSTNWAAALDALLVGDLFQYRSYKYTSVRDLLRVIRNKHNHFREMPPGLQQLLGEPPDAYLTYFERRFPYLFLTMFYFIVRTGCRDESLFAKYELKDIDFDKCMTVHEATIAKLAPPPVPFSNDLQALLGSTAGASAGVGAQSADGVAATAAGVADAAAAPVPLAVVSLDNSGNDESPRRPVAPAVPEVAVSDSHASTLSNDTAPIDNGKRSPSECTVGSTSSLPPPRAPSATGPNGTPGRGTGGGKGNRGRNRGRHASRASASSNGGNSEGGNGFRHGAHQSTGSGLPALDAGGQIQVGWRVVDSDDGQFEYFPRNTGSEICSYYVQTGHCKYGQSCFKDHPPEYAVKKNLRGFPLRSGADVCSFYMQNGSCKFGPNCKFHHPNIEPLYAGSAAPPPPPQRRSDTGISPAT